MMEGFPGELAAAAILTCAGLLASVGLDRLTLPRGTGLWRPAPAFAIHAGLFLAAWSMLWMVLGRPGFAAAATLAGQFLVVAVSNAKFRALREPFIYSDVGLFSQVFRFPRLYLPFFGAWRALAVAVGAGVAVAVGLFLEESRPGSRTFALGLFAFAGVLLLVGSRRSSPPRLDPVADLAGIGLFPSLWLYWLAELGPAPVAPVRAWLDRPMAAPPDGALPDLVVVQSESFFDARRLYHGIRPELLDQFDALRAQALMHGRLSVPAWGANTMRTEFAVLSGIGEEALGVHRFNPYRRFARNGVTALPHRLRTLGYRTVCIHPHPAGFFGRDRVFPGLGFDRFIDIDDFPGAQQEGPYVADAAVTRKIVEVLAETNQPTFVFAITMENHGPLHLEQVGPGDTPRFFATAPPSGWEDLTVYLRHLVNADRMFGNLAEHLAARSRGGLLCLFGDHVPSMPAVYADLGYADQRTEYLIWPALSGPRGRVDLAAHQLAEILLSVLQEAGRSPVGDDPRAARSGSPVDAVLAARIRGPAAP